MTICHVLDRARLPFKSKTDWRGSSIKFCSWIPPAQIREVFDDLFRSPRFLLHAFMGAPAGCAQPLPTGRGEYRANVYSCSAPCSSMSAAEQTRSGDPSKSGRTDCHHHANQPSSSLHPWPLRRIRGPRVKPPMLQLIFTGKRTVAPRPFMTCSVKASCQNTQESCHDRPCQPQHAAG
ncbi:uncharacterized protein LAESUDRAFT_231413 [Laetiporus sulphureus 93-53]|uniref:Uncharacterized protein n=1 Tax=Laetiporus sulphureus 93-53 TaxID=1314785 RepID=A0A165DR32_9APHY|nr:uncharacterized protein LAESUDRAFT_231413 [Laetiporus sulphureus 93-53]KZT05447.1 hypothetical protein LAESUDRAFT_231413 [Laetiporus sulphureus 93-53]